MGWFLTLRRRLMGRFGGALASALDPNMIIRNNLIDKPEFQSAFEAFDGGNVTQAFEIFRDLAVSGDAAAQHNVGVLYECGLPYRDDEKAEQWYRVSAEQGLADAQYQLAAILASDAMAGEIEAGDLDKGERFTEAYKWLLLADAQGHDLSRNSLRRLAKHMTEGQLARAKQMAGDEPA